MNGNLSRWSMGSEAVGGRRYRLQRRRQVKEESSPNFERAFELAINGVTRVASLKSVAANEDLIRDSGNKLSSKQSDILQRGVTLTRDWGFSTTYSTTTYDGVFWRIEFGNRGETTDTPVEVYRVSPQITGADWERQIIGTDDDLQPFLPSYKDARSIRTVIEESIACAAN